MDNRDIIDFLGWMAKEKICSVIPFFVIQDGRDGRIPHWTDGKTLYNAKELYENYITSGQKDRKKKKLLHNV